MLGIVNEQDAGILEDDFTSLKWKKNKRPDTFYPLREVYSISKEIGFNTGIEWQIIRPDPLRAPHVFELKWDSYGSYETNSGNIGAILKSKDDLENIMSYFEIS